uniref:Tail component n=2 Tax=unclassified Caudoviricetes TaxID=2788787 RepID=A0A8S5UZL9_9CAUD|nr:MAG TPA: tail component [Siphoviridae sp. ctZPw9]DAF99798.1 MAG TPA: tail component [Siphoviridae sp. ctPNJ4]
MMQQDWEEMKRLAVTFQVAAKHDFSPQVLAAGKLLRDEAKRRAPVRTGFLRSKISAAKAGKNAADVISAAPYAAYVEFGTSKMAPRAHLRPAIDASMDDMVAAIVEGVEL